MTIRAYNISSDKKVLNKALSYVRDIAIKEKMDKDILYPEYILKKGNVLDFNYIYDEEFGKFYYVNKYHHEKGFIVIECECDVLMTNRSRILNLFALIERNEFEFNPYMYDNELITRCDHTIITQNIGRVGVSGPNYNYYLCVNGGGSDNGN